MKVDGERLAVLEQKVTDLGGRMSELQIDVKTIINQLAKQPSLEMEIAGLKLQIAQLEKTAGFWKWFSPTLSAIASAVITFLFISFLTHK